MHRDKDPTVDLSITFLQTETELEERLTSRASSANTKPNSSAVNQIRSDSHNLCALCKQPRHRFVDCNVFQSNTPQQQTDAIRKLGR